MNLRKLWLVARGTYWRQVRSLLFLIMTFALPLLMIAAGAASILLGGDDVVSTVGWVDLTGQLVLDQAAIDPESGLTLVSYDEQSQAEAALQAQEIDAYLVLPEDYLSTAPPVFHGPAAPEPALYGALEDALRHALAPEAPGWVHERLAESAIWSFEDLETGNTFADGMELFLRAVLPGGLGMLFALILLTTITNMGQAIVREKEERAMEMVLTSLRPVELVGGKILGLSLLSLTQAAIWGLGAAIAIGVAWVGEGHTGIPRLPWGAVVWALALGVPGYMLYAALAAGLGIISGDMEQAKQNAGILSMVGMAPLWFMGLILFQPDSSLAVGLTLVPLFAPTLALYRMVMTEVPAWQLWTALILILISLAVVIWVVARIFRAAALLYGQLLTPRQIWRALWEART